MNINLTEIINNDGGSLVFSEKVHIDPVKYMGEKVCFDDGVIFEGEIKNISGVFELKGKISGLLSANCSLCLERLERSFAAYVSETVVREGSEGEKALSADDDVIVISDYFLPIDEIVLNNILINLDVKYLCSQDCRGLCPKCGKNLNKGDCGCDRSITDPRFEVLSKLMDN